MKKAIFLFTALLILWIAGCTYCYVCNIRNDCRAGTADITQDESQTVSINADSLTVNAGSPDQTSEPPRHTLWFDTGMVTCQPGEEDNQYFLLLKEYLMENPGKMVMLTGFADNTGSEAVNLKITAQRAGFVKQLLMASGIDEMKIKTTAKGSLEPAGDNNTPEGRKKNRRVEIHII
jgi:outer membrane protein OmpA-like peptidoglycan-associated protein